MQWSCDVCLELKRHQCNKIKIYQPPFVLYHPHPAKQTYLRYKLNLSTLLNTSTVHSLLAEEAFLQRGLKHPRYSPRKWHGLAIHRWKAKSVQILESVAHNIFEWSILRKLRFSHNVYIPLMTNTFGLCGICLEYGRHYIAMYHTLVVSFTLHYVHSTCMPRS